MHLCVCVLSSSTRLAALQPPTLQEAPGAVRESVRAGMRACTPACVCALAQHALTHCTSTHKHTHAHALTNTHKHTHTHSKTHTSTCTHKHTHMHTHTHTRARAEACMHARTGRSGSLCRGRRAPGPPSPRSCPCCQRAARGSQAGTCGAGSEAAGEGDEC